MQGVGVQGLAGFRSVVWEERSTVPRHTGRIKPRHRESKPLCAVCTFLCTAGCFKTRVGSQQRGKRPTLSWKAWGRRYQMSSYTGVAAFREWACCGLRCDPTFLCAMIMTREGGVHPRHLTMLYGCTCNLPSVCLSTISVLLRRGVSLLAAMQRAVVAEKGANGSCVYAIVLQNIINSNIRIDCR